MTTNLHNQDEFDSDVPIMKAPQFNKKGGGKKNMFIIREMIEYLFVVFFSQLIFQAFCLSQMKMTKITAVIMTKRSLTGQKLPSKTTI